MSQKIRDFIRVNQPATPCLVFDTAVVAENYNAFRAGLPYASVYYAVKANPDAAILQLLSDLGSNFDCASVEEVQMVLSTGAAGDRISFGNTIKKERDIARAYALGVRLFAVDAVEEVEKVARAAPGADVFCRILSDGDGAEWPLSRKFGCDKAMAPKVLRLASALGLRPRGVSFHVGSQMTNPDGWDAAIGDAAEIFAVMSAEGIELDLVNLGGGFPTTYLKQMAGSDVYGKHIHEAILRRFGNRSVRFIIEPGRGMVGNAGIIVSEVVLISRKSEDDRHRWVYLDIGKFGGLAETMEEAIRYRIETEHDGSSASECVIAGPTCDSADVLYEKTMYPLPEALKIGDHVMIASAGAYTTTYSAVAFNGFAPLRSYVL